MHTTRVPEFTFTLQEYRIAGVEVIKVSHTYECCPDDPPWPALLYTIDLGRASLYYTMLTVVPSALLTYLSTAVFLMSPDVGERLSCAPCNAGNVRYARDARDVLRNVRNLHHVRDVCNACNVRDNTVTSERQLAHHGL